MREAISQYYAENYEVLCKTVQGRVGGMYNAEDVVQEAFVRALTYAESFDSVRASLPTWIGTILRRAMFDFKRAELQQGMVREESDPEEPMFDFPERCELTIEGIRKDIEAVSDPEHRDVLRLTYVHQYTPREIEEIMDLGLANIKKVRLRFKNEMVAKYGTED